MGEKSFLIDTTKCIGCGACSLACKGLNSLEPTEFNHEKIPHLSQNDWIVSFKNVRNPDAGENACFITLMCNHCTEADCVKVCPSGAMKKKNDFVLIDPDKCIACGSCVEACVYNAVFLGKNAGGRKLAKKCDACYSAFKNVPLCVSVCPTGALKFDYRLKMIKEANRRISALAKKYKSPSVYGLTEYGGLNVLTIVRTDDDLKAVKRKTAANRIDRMIERSELFRIFNFFMPSFRTGKEYLYKILKSIV
ncbi:MAG: 4Fe-4S binding protein [Spirochaetes bacterium]|nr:4Fe-4S binding protein [Spirochaetota bacterium]